VSTFLDWLRGTDDLAESGGDAVDTVAEMQEMLRAEQESNLLLLEENADLELALEDRGWRRMSLSDNVEFSRSGMRRMVALCQVMAVKNPLIKRGLALRTFYVWGLGVSIAARSTGPDRDNAQAQDVNAVVQEFLDDDGNKASLTGEQAHEENERALGTDGNVFFALFTSPLTGRVQVRTLPFDEVDDVITNPEDRSEPWFYKRRWTATVIDPVTATAKPTEQIAYYPARGYRPAARFRTIDGHPVYWDAPVVHVRVNGKATWKFGIPDAYAAIDWARAFKEFLEDWAKLVKALSRFAFRATTPGSKARRQAVAAKLSEAAPVSATTGRTQDVGATAVTAPGQTLEAIPKTGATIDSESGRPLAMMVAAALDVPVTMLLSDPGQTGARATAETLDRPTELMAGMRRAIWGAALQQVLSYVVDSAVKAPRGPLKGTVTRDPETGRERVTLAGDTERTVDVTFPDLDEVDIEKVMKALTAADSLDVVPPLVLARLVLQALGVEQVDEILEELVDENGNFVSPSANAGQAAADAFRQGRDPVGAVGEPNDPTGGAR
jgi:hypothetical protein